MASKPLTPKQKNLVKLMPQVEAGKLSLKEAMQQAGYADSTAEQQSTILGGLRSNTKMQEALRKVGFDEGYLAGGIVEGTQATELIGTKITRERPDYRARGIYYKLGAELLDAFPAKKSIEAQADIADLIKLQESTTPTDAGDS